MDEETRKAIADVGRQLRVTGLELESTTLTEKDLLTMIKTIDINKATLELIHLRMNR